MEVNVTTVQLELADENLKRRIQDVLKENADMLIIDTNDPRRPDLLIYEIGEDSEKDFQVIRSILQEDQAGEVFLAAECTEPSLLMEAMRAGVKECLLNQATTDEIKQAIERFKTRNQRAIRKVADRQGQIISVVASKGGVGVTTIAVNLAVALSQKKPASTVALLDMNALYGEIPLFLELDPKFHWGEITRHIDRLDSALLMNVLSKHNSGVHVLSSPTSLNDHVSTTPETVTKLLAVMRTMFDYILIDVGQSMNPAALRVCELSDHLMLAAVLSLTCLTNTGRLKKSLIALNVTREEKIKLVINRHTKHSEISLKDAEEGVDQKAFWMVPNDYRATMAAINNGKPLTDIAPHSPIAKSFKELAEIVAPTQQDNKRRTWWPFSK